MQKDKTSPIMMQHNRKPANPCTLIIFGITGDLTKRLLFPAICNLGSQGLLDENFCIVGVGREANTHKAFRLQFKKNIEQYVKDEDAKKFGLALLSHIYYVAGNFNTSKTYNDLKKQLTTLSKKDYSLNYLFYFAAPPQFMETIATHLNKIKLLKEEKKSYYRRVIVEKPFGHDLASAIALNKKLLSLMQEKQIFRIDHFLGKETVQNLMAFRFSNGLFEPIWNRFYIDHVQITVAETLGVEARGGYYESAGALRDMVPNHIFQMLSLIAMEPPNSFTAKDIRAEKVKAIHAIQPLTPEKVLSQIVRGQYDQGKINNVKVPAYRQEKNVAEHSPVETYAALKLFIDNSRWWKVPFYLRTGKRMSTRRTEIIVQFKSGPCALFNPNETIVPNALHIFIQPDEGISLCFNAKIPGPSLELGQVEMKFKYSDYFGVKTQTGYEMILYDCMNGDKLLFKQAEMIEAGWKVVQPILDVWGALTPQDFPNYAAGSNGPKEADELIEKDGRKWIL